MNITKLVAVTSTAVLGAALAVASEQPIKFKNLPAAVQKTAKEESKGAVVKGYSKEIEGGKTVYEVETKVNGKGRDLLIDQSGALVEVEQEVETNALPAGVLDGLKKLAAGSALGEVESVTKGGVVTYEAEVKKGGKKIDIAVDSSGNPVK